MACSSPLYAWNTGRLTENGKPLYCICRDNGAPPSIRFANKQLKWSLDRPLGLGDFPDGFLKECIRVPCGKCDGCLMDRSRLWADRVTVEAASWPWNWFVTITYDNKHLPPFDYDYKRELSLYVKRVRNKFGKGVRFFASFELGAKTLRPHFHVIFFNLHLTDLRLFNNAGPDPLYESPVLSSCWPFGMSVIGKVTPESAAYVARYTMKKAGDRTGFINMSRKPGIGCAFFLDNFDRISRNKAYPVGLGRVAPPPRYFKRLADKYGVVLDLEPEKARTLSELRRLSTQARLHLPDEDAYYSYLRSENRHKADRLKKRRSL